MRLLKPLTFVAAGLWLALALPIQPTQVLAQQPGAGGAARGGGGGGRGQMEVWSPMPVKANPFVAPNKALTKLTDLLAKHKGQANWKEVLFNDLLFHGEYISMGPGEKTPRRFH